MHANPLDMANRFLVSPSLRSSFHLPPANLGAIGQYEQLRSSELPRGVTCGSSTKRTSLCKGTHCTFSQQSEKVNRRRASAWAMVMLRADATG